ncbi:hypothetical protein R3P38DRAFT_2803672 [Favolaschia claudopus]|uniref:Uncharacterized protein n=1 Tax=Favolaschia claudopus TaxID=2862362 RepID=A0AAV9ZSC3_9AGAR
MPEPREAKCSFIICDEYFGPILVKDGALPLERIDIDATEKEQKRFPKSHPAHQGLPDAIDSSCTAKRGTNKSQGSIQFLTHTSAHPMSRAAYESSIKVVNKEAQHIKERARIDEDFCLIIASLIFPRVAILHGRLFQLTGYSSTKKDNRERVEKALQDYHFIFPVVWKKAAAAADGAADDAANPKLEIKFQANLPFHSGPIIDTINEKFFSKPRCSVASTRSFSKGLTAIQMNLNSQIPWFEPDYTAGQVAVTLTPAGTPKHALKQRTGAF